MPIKDGTFFRIEAFMRNDLNLKGNELMAYALIYGFQKATGKPFDGTQDFISEWLGISRRSVVSVLTNLENQGFVKSFKSKHGYTHQKSYICIHNSLENSQKTKKQCEKTSHPRCEKTSQLNVKNLHNQLCKNFTINCEETSHNIDSYTNTYKNIHTDRTGRNEFCFRVLRAITQNQNQLQSKKTKEAFLKAVSSLKDDAHPDPASELVFIWNSTQTEMKLDGREAQFMPNLCKWLTNDAVERVQSSRTGRHYSNKRCEEMADKLAAKHGINCEVVND